jgi:hypothetical protein
MAYTIEAMISVLQKVGVSIVSIVISLITFWLVILDRNRPPAIGEQNIRVVDRVEPLLDQGVSTPPQGSDTNCNTSEPNSNTGDACTNIHKH